jgi:hypothetical protein
MSTFRKILVGIGLAGALSLGIVWGDRAPAVQHAVQHMVLAEIPPIQKPGH